MTAFMLNLGIASDPDKTPNVLEHSQDYFALLKQWSGQPPLHKPLAHCVQNNMPPGIQKDPLELPCGKTDPQKFNPPDSEFCIQMAI
jgi:hypothetical protein